MQTSAVSVAAGPETFSIGIVFGACAGVGGAEIGPG